MPSLVCLFMCIFLGVKFIVLIRFSEWSMIQKMF